MSSSAASGLLDRRGENRAGASSLLPLPLRERLTESAASQVTKSQRRHAERAVNEAVRAINWLLGWTTARGRRTAAMSSLHFEAQQRVEEAVLRWPSAVCALDDSSSLREMLKEEGDTALRLPRRTYRPISVHGCRCQSRWETRPFWRRYLTWRIVAFSRVTRRECYGRQRPWRVFCASVANSLATLILF